MQEAKELSNVKKLKTFCTSLISTRLVKWPEANIGHCFLATNAIHISKGKRKEGTRSESGRPVFLDSQSFAYIISFEQRIYVMIHEYTYTHIKGFQHKHVHNTQHIKKYINFLAEVKQFDIPNT